ncbi:hypothetical protein IJT93_12335 [bacterium]|nr:hypothetical protein [bacterium]
MRSIRKFHELAPYRVREVLLLASEYDFFVLEAEGQLAELLFFKYTEFYMVGAPRISHVTSAEQAIEFMQSRRVDLVVEVLREGENNIIGSVDKVRRAFPSLPIVLLILDEMLLRRSNISEGLNKVAGVFLWTGDFRLTTAIFNYVEDILNVDSDTAHTGVQVIIAVEDRIGDYSILLTHLYDELMEQSRLLSGEGVNFAQRMLRMLARPKILLAENYEEAQRLFDRHSRYVLALISDVSFVREGQKDEEAGFKLAEYCSARKQRLPVLLQSSDAANRQRSEAKGWHFAFKHPDKLRQALHLFLEESLGFGDFVFRMPDRREVARAHDTYDLENLLRTVDLQSVYYHASNNHFNVWLRARNYFDLADEVEQIRAEDFPSPEKLRDYIIEVLNKHALLEQNGRIADFTPKADSHSLHNFFKIGGGSVGGKGRGIAFINSRLANDKFIGQFAGLKVDIPKTVVLGTDIYDSFMEFNGFVKGLQKNLSDEELQKLYASARLPDAVSAELKAALKLLHGPLAVRSSSLLEDSQNQSCAGIYATCMVPDSSSESEERFKLICSAVKRVYMSAVASKARAYLENARYPGEEEKMAVIVQELVGRQHGRYFYPDFAGVAMSSNYYPMAPQKPEDGVAAMALGFGKTVAGGENCVRFSPKWPKLLPHEYYQGKYLKYSQKKFYALDLESKGADSPDAIVSLPLSQAEEDGTLAQAASVFCTKSGAWRDSLMYEGPRAVTFSNILAWEALPLAKVLDKLLERFKLAIGCPVELEFAVENPPGGEAVLYLLQIRPLLDISLGESVQTCGYAEEDIFCTCNSLGHGCADDLYDIIYVADRDPDPKKGRLTAARIGRLNEALLKENRPYVLIGPGRWGSSDPSLGIPVQTGQILGAKVIIELPYGSRFVEPSMGSHFFHELASMRIGYMTVSFLNDELCDNITQSRLNTVCREEQSLRCIEHINRDFIDLLWLQEQECLSREEGVLHLRLSSPLHMRLNGRCCRGTILKKAADNR